MRYLLLLVGLCLIGYAVSRYFSARAHPAHARPDALPAGGIMDHFGELLFVIYGFAVWGLAAVFWLH